MPTRPMTRPIGVAALLTLLALAPIEGASTKADRIGDPAIRVLVFTRAQGFVHGSIDDGVAMIETLGTENGFVVDETDQADVFTAGGLAPYDVVVWLSTTGDVLDAGQQAAFEAYLQAGGGYVGIHAAADCEYDWPWYGILLGDGAWFLSHPQIQTATLQLEAPDHPAAGFTAAETPFEDEWYNFRANPRPAVEVIMTLDESSYNPGSGAMGDDHPIVWAQEIGLGRAFYTGLGHRSETYADLRFRAQILGAIRWAGQPVGTVFADGFATGDTSAWSTTVPTP